MTPSDPAAGRVARRPPPGDGVAPPLFEFDDVEVRVAGAVLLDGVSATVPDAGVTVVAGPSGSGKTTLLRLCNRLEVPSAGRVRFRGRDVADVEPLVLRRKVGMVFQRPVLFAGTVRENFHVAAPHADDDRCRAVLERVALQPTFLDRIADDLSGGEAQRVCLARTLLTGPHALLLDEPTSALDAGPRLALEAVAKDLARSGVTVLWVTHDAEQLRRLSDHLLVLRRGRVVYAGGVAGCTAHDLTRLLTGDPL